MIYIRPEDTIHKSYLNRLLIEIIDRPLLSKNLVFKGGTCAAMLGYLDRFSVDLDFDVKKNTGEKELRKELHHIFELLDMKVTVEFDKALFFQLRYPAAPGKRNTLKLSASSIYVKANQYTASYLPEIDRFMTCQTVETMFANKLVAMTDRFRLYKTVAGRDIYDIHHFFLAGYSYYIPVIEERTGLTASDYFIKLVDFIKKHVTQTIINEDLNTLLPPKKFQQIRKVLVPETLALLEREQQRLQS
jgi:predicted nucleotidyltransferase component of viral defense system